MKYGQIPILNAPKSATGGAAGAIRDMLNDESIVGMGTTYESGWLDKPTYFCSTCEGPISEARFEEMGICRECEAEKKAESAASMDPDNLSGRDLEDVG